MTYRLSNESQEPEVAIVDITTVVVAVVIVGVATIVPVVVIPLEKGIVTILAVVTVAIVPRDAGAATAHCEDFRDLHIAPFPALAR
jgi:hypothetical protein